MYPQFYKHMHWEGKTTWNCIIAELYLFLNSEVFLSLNVVLQDVNLHYNIRGRTDIHVSGRQNALHYDMDWSQNIPLRSNKNLSLSNQCQGC